MCSYTPLTPTELVAAVCQDPEMDAIDCVDIDMGFVLAACHNLLMVDQELRVCRFSHLSVQEYFENHYWSQSQANSLVAKVCLSLLNDPIQQNLDPQPANKEDRNDGIRDIVQYARLHWVTHVQRHGEETIDDRLAILLKRFLGSMNESGLAYRNWYRMVTNFFAAQGPEYDIPLYRIYKQLAPPSLASFAICAFGFHKILSDWWVSGFANIDQKNHQGELLLGLASAGGHDQIVQRLLEKGADVNAQGGYYGNALQAASVKGHDQIVQLLLEKGADVNAQGDRGGYYGNALQAASAGGHDQVVQRLLEKGADVNAQCGYHGNALQAASAGGHDQVVQRLLENGADVNAQSGYYGNALQAASARDHDQIVQRLLENGADVNARGGYYGNALQAASAEGHDQVVQRLLEKGANVNAQGGYHGNALQAASAKGHDQIVQRLLEKGADVNAQGGGYYGNALQAASAEGHDQIVQLLKSAAQSR
jgi:ankyrin repeat protein